MARKKKGPAAPVRWEDVPEIPMEEQPYRLPEGWKWVKLEEVACIIMGQSPAGVDTTEDSSYTPLIGGASDLGTLYPCSKKYTKKPTKLSKIDDIILCIRATLGKPVFSDGIYCLGRGVAAIRPLLLDRNFLRYFFINFESYFYKHAVGSTFLQISGNKLKEMPVPYPRLEIQQQIAACIESFLSQLDEAAEKVQTVIDSHEARKQAILHRAFSGELTKEWRKENGLPFDWQEKELKDIGEIITGSTPSTKNPAYYGAEIPFIKPTDLNKGRYVTQSAEYLSTEGKKVSRPVRAGSTCVCCIGSIGKCGFLTCDAVTNQQINTISPYDFMNELYVYYWCVNDRFTNDLMENSSSTTLSIINKSKMSKLKIPVPSKAEQKALVEILEPVFFQLNLLNEVAGNALLKIHLLKKTILEKAFRGELAE